MKEEQGEGYLMKKWALEKPQQVMGKINGVQKMLEKLQKVMDKIHRTLEVQGKLQQVGSFISIIIRWLLLRSIGLGS